jgi:stage II sporulation protein R
VEEGKLKMKKILVLMCLLAAVGLLVGWISSTPEENKESINPNIIRFHVRANSDSEGDQALKKKVRNAVLAKFSNLSETQSIEQARLLIEQNLKGMEKEAARVIAQNGKTYPVRVEYGVANFPLKSYGEINYPAGQYEAVQIIIGEGKGQNWWCVLFPPLCFVDVTSSLSANPGISKPVIQNDQQGQPVKPVVKFKTVEVVKELAAKLHK